MSNDDAPEDRRTEGVRILGAQEAAEAAGRPDVVRRRRRGEKRFGDRPDAPEPTSDLPKITISTTEGEPADRYGEPVAAPAQDPERAGFGHARLVDPEPEDPAEPADPGDEPVAAAPVGSGHDGGPEWDDPYEPPRWDDEPTAGGSEPAGDDWDDPWTDEPAEGPAATSSADPGTAPLAAADDDEAFVLPHWTEPPTGQVPRIVAGEGADDPDALAAYDSGPRWRDEGERTSVTDFDDLVDDGPRLGALGNDSVEDAFFSDPVDGDGDGYEDEWADDEWGDEEWPDAEVAPVATARRVRREDAAPPGGGDRHLLTAVAVGVGLIALGLLCFALGSVTTTLLAAAVVTAAGFEYFTQVRERGNNPATLLGVVAIAGLMIAASTSGLAAYPVVLGITTVFGLLWYLWVAPGPGAVANLGLTLLGVLWIGGLGSFATLFVGLGSVLQDNDPGLESNPGIGVLLAAVIASVSQDVGGYFVGRYLGRTPLSAASPNKTQEGLVGGVLSSLVVTMVVVGFIGIEPIGSSLSQAFIFALLCALAAPLGDLCESFIKRDLGIKDMGSSLPGHGGLLDRFDGLLFVLPVAYFVTVLFDIWSGVGS